MNFFRLVLLFLVGLGALFVDFWTKAFIYYGHLSLPYPIFHNWLGIDFQLSLTYNRGAAWGLFSSFQTPLLILRLVVIVALILYLVFAKKSRGYAFPLVLIIAGAIGNVVDYFLYGFVIDFLSFNFWGYPFPIFNLADTFITVGVAWLLLAAIFTKKNDVKCL